MAGSKKHPLLERTKNLAHDCVKIVSTLPSTKLCSVVSYQLIKSATSTAANYRAAYFAQNKAAFVAKLSIVIEELDESKFWIEFLRDEKMISPDLYVNVLKEANELLSILVSSRMTMQGKTRQ
jgi:four helix bundle protein